jgi:hypothetical protein
MPTARAITCWNELEYVLDPLNVMGVVPEVAIY